LLVTTVDLLDGSVIRLL